jgi:valyl-tRNA synthetase
VVIETTRPELIAACVALVAHPDDERYQPLFGTTARTPLFGVEVPVVAHPLAEPDKGTGIAMICTFGDTTDVTWWRELDLPTRAIVGPRRPDPPRLARGRRRRGLRRYRRAGRQDQAGPEGHRRAAARAGELLGEPRPITHPVKFYEKGDRPLEIVTSRQWYIRNGGRDAELRAAARGAAVR